MNISHALFGQVVESEHGEIFRKSFSAKILAHGNHVHTAGVVLRIDKGGYGPDVLAVKIDKEQIPGGVDILYVEY